MWCLHMYLGTLVDCEPVDLATCGGACGYVFMCMCVNLYPLAVVPSGWEIASELYGICMAMFGYGTSGLWMS